MKHITQQLRRLDSADALKRRMAHGPSLAFVQRADNPLKGIPAGLPPEAAFAATTERLEAGLSGGIRKQMAAFDGQGRSDYYCVLCFEQGEQLDAFLKGVGYPEPDAKFIDGPKLAHILDIEIPQPTFRLKPLRKPDSALARLVTAFPRRLT